jgi:hypothetical protein
MWLSDFAASLLQLWLAVSLSAIPARFTIDTFACQIFERLVSFSVQLQAVS